MTDNPFPTDPNAANPYSSPLAAPGAVPPVVPTPQKLRIASQGKRFLNLIVDNIVIQVLSAGTGLVLGAAYAVTRVSSGDMITPEEEFGLQMIGMVAGMLVAVGYFVVTESLFQRTVGKFLTGTLVVTANGSCPSFGQIVGRSFARLIPFEAFSFLGGNNPVGWHDSLSGTRVISTR